MSFRCVSLANPKSVSLIRALITTTKKPLQFDKITTKNLNFAPKTQKSAPLIGRGVQQVLRLDVAVRDIAVMQVQQRQADFVHNLGRLALSERALLTVLDPLEQFAALHAAEEEEFLEIGFPFLGSYEPEKIDQTTTHHSMTTSRHLVPLYEFS